MKMFVVRDPTLLRVVLTVTLLLAPVTAKDTKKSSAPQRKLRTEHAAALKWLTAHQDKDGRWDTDGFMKHDPPMDKCDGAGILTNDLGVTSLALLAFLRSGYTDAGSTEENPFAKNIKRGLSWLIKHQEKSGRIFEAHSSAWIYGHAIATYAPKKRLKVKSSSRSMWPKFSRPDTMLFTSSQVPMLKAT